MAKSMTRVSDILVFKDEAGNIYLLDNPTLNNVRVPDEYKADIEKALKAEDDESIQLVFSENPPFKIVGRYTLKHTGGFQIAQVLRAL